MLRRIAFLATISLALLLLPMVMAADEPAPADTPPAPLTVPAVAPPAPVTQEMAPAATILAPDTQILRRTPVIDGVIDAGEWDTYYANTAGDWQVTTYANWDGSNLYVGVKSSKPVDLSAVLDANNDGWFHGDENFEFKAIRDADSNLTLAVCSYESRNTKSPVATPISAMDAATVELKSTRSADAFVIEMRVPNTLIPGFRPAVGRTIGFQVSVKAAAEESGWVPTSQVGELTECTLVNKKFAALKPLVLGFDLKDAKVARGEELVGRFHLMNDGTETLDARNYILAGEGKAGAYLSAERIRVEGLPPKKHVSREMRTLIPTDMPLGSWALGAEVRSTDGRMGAALVSFDVVDPFEVALRLPIEDVRADVKDVTFRVMITNHTRRTVRGKTQITLPPGWELWKGVNTREFQVGPRGGETFVVFKAKPPLGEMGVVPVKAEVTIGAETKTVEGKITMVAP